MLAEAEKIVDFTQAFTIVEQEPADNVLYLRLNTTGLAVVSPVFNPLYVSEIYSKLVIRYQNLKNELLIQALNSSRGSSVWDLTAGLGKDAFILASSGYQVTMVEQNPLLATIVYYALTYKILPTHNLQLIYANSLDFLSVAENRPDIIYLDPMFKDDKAAKAKKEMQLIQMVTANNPGQNLDSALFAASYTKALNKIIVKRDNKQEALVKLPLASYTKSGKTIRFDVYVLS